MAAVISSIILLAIAFGALAFVAHLALQISKKSAGTPKMREIATAIQEGAMAFMMREYKAYDASEDARRIAREQRSTRVSQTRAPMREIAGRIPDPESFDASRGGREVKIDSRGTAELRYGNHDVDLRCVEQLLDASQTRAIGQAIHLASQRFMGPGRHLRDVLDELDALIDAEGLDVLDPFARRGQSPAALARPRRFEIAAAINRLRTLRVSRSHARE